jgi:membrane protein implicated in regulation of membrane protease activity
LSHTNSIKYIGIRKVPGQGNLRNQRRRFRLRRRFMKKAWSRRTLLKYMLFQIPDLAVLVLLLIYVRRWLELPVWLDYALILFWILKDAFMFRYAWRAYDSDSRRNPIIGATGIAEQRLAPSGYIRIKDEFWKAELMDRDREIAKGEPVRVREVKGLTLIVEPESKEA